MQSDITRTTRLPNINPTCVTPPQAVSADKVSSAKLTSCQAASSGKSLKHATCVQAKVRPEI